VPSINIDLTDGVCLGCKKTTYVVNSGYCLNCAAKRFS
jgi:hypothetical protein